MQFFRNTATKSHDHPVFELFLGYQVLVCWQVLSIAQSALATWDDAYFQKWIGVFQEPTTNSMAGFVISHGPFFLFGKNPCLFLEPSNDSFDGLFKMVNRDVLVVVSGSNQSRLITGIGDVRTSETWGQCGQFPGKIVHIISEQGIQVESFQMHQIDLLSTVDIGRVDLDVSVEPPRSHKGVIQHVGSICTGKDNDLVGSGKPVHFHQQLVQSGFPFVVSATKSATFASFFTDSVDFVYEDDGGGHRSGLGEQVSYTGGTDPDEHFHELGTGHRKEGHVGLARGSLGQEGLTGTWGSGKNGASGDLGAQFGVLGRVFQEMDELHDFLFGLITASNVLEGDLYVGFLVEQFCLGLADIEHAAKASTAGAAVGIWGRAVDFPCNEVEPTKKDHGGQEGEQKGEGGGSLDVFDGDSVAGRDVQKVLDLVHLFFEDVDGADGEGDELLGVDQLGLDEELVDDVDLGHEALFQVLCFEVLEGEDAVRIVSGVVGGSQQGEYDGEPNGQKHCVFEFLGPEVLGGRVELRFALVVALVLVVVVVLVVIVWLVFIGSCCREME